MLKATKYLIGLVGLSSATLVDPSTYANTDYVRTTHLTLDFKVDFHNETFDGKVVHNMTFLKENVTEVIMDAQGMVVKNVQL